MTGRLFARRPQDPPPVAQMLGLVALTGLLGLVLMPWIWALVSSFKPRAEIMSTGFLPSVWIVDNYVALFRDTLYLRWLFNSAVVSVSAAVLGMALSAMAGYAFAKFRFVGREVLFWIVIASVSIPPFTTVIPLFGWLAKLQMLNTYPVLILPFAASAFGLFMMRQYMSTLPDELIEAARIDGANEAWIFVRIILPLIRGPIGALAVLAFFQAWTAFTWPLIVSTTTESYTVEVGLALFQTGFTIDLGRLSAASALVLIPSVTVFVFLRRSFVQGVASSGLKD
jgi:ABC-type glycerol-3-phosphate transport system permease component